MFLVVLALLVWKGVICRECSLLLFRLFGYACYSLFRMRELSREFIRELNELVYTRGYKSVQELVILSVGGVTFFSRLCFGRENDVADSMCKYNQSINRSTYISFNKHPIHDLRC